MSAHTPGPWFVDPSEQRAPSDPFRLGGNRIFKVCMERGGLIADVSAWWVDTQSAEANAQLIAAAPELLAALRAIMAKRKRMGLGDDETHVTARAAIAKAEGRGTL